VWEIVHELPEWEPGGPLVYGSLPYEPGVRSTLVALLLRRLGELAPRWAGAAAGSLSLSRTYLGQPRLLVDGRPGPGLSFAHAGGRLWAALAAAGMVGLDLASREEGAGFAVPQDLVRLAARLGGDAADAAALLRAMKGAALKALGVGFRYADPGQLQVTAPTLWPGGVRCAVRAGGLVPVYARREGRFWLALAVRVGFEDLAR